MAYVAALGSIALALLLMQSQGGSPVKADPTKYHHFPDFTDAKTIPFSGNVAFQAVNPDDFDVAPEWIQRPSSEAIGSFFPGIAMKEGLEGSAALRCTLTIDGGLTGCTVKHELPSEKGFGGAAKSLAADFSITPAMKNGQPVATPIDIAIKIVAPPLRAGSVVPGRSTLGAQKVVDSVPWSRAPSYAEVVAAYPAQAKARGLGGRATLFCTFDDQGALRGCRVSSEEPAGLGFGKAAMQLMPAFKTDAKLPSGASIGGYGVKVPFIFAQRMLKPDRPAEVAAMSAMPSNAEYAAVYPRYARTQGILSSEVILDCGVETGGVLDDCKVASETPVDYGFAEAALELTPKFQVRQWSADGLPAVGGRVLVPFKYQLKTAG